MKTILKKIEAIIPICVSIILLFSSCNKSKIDNQTTIFKDVNIITMCNDSIFYGHSVLVRDGKIADIGIFEEMGVPDNTQIIDGKEQFLIPGLSDMHVHISDVDDRFLYIANGVTLVRNMAGFSYHLKLRDNINKRHLVGPEIYTTGLTIDGVNPYWPLSSIVVDDKEKVFEVLSLMKKDGYDAIKIYEKLTKEVYYEIIRVANELKLPVVGHVPQSLSLRDVLSSGQTSIEHLDGYQSYYGIDLIIKETVKSGIWNCPTLLVHKNYGNLDSVKKYPPSEIKYVSPRQVNYWKSFNQLDSGPANNMKLLNTLTNNNANIVVGTDAGTVYVVPGFSLHEELSLRQDAGLTPYQVLLSATRSCAEMLGYESRLGTIEKGKDADLVLLKNNPLEDINNTRTINGVMTKGHWYPKEQINSMLDDVAAKKNSLMQKSTARNSVFIKSLLLILALTFLSTLLVRPILFVFSRRKLKSIINQDIHITKYRIRFFVITLSIINLIILYLVASLPEVDIQSGLPTTLVGATKLLRYEILLPFINLIFIITLSVLYIIGLLKKEFSTYRKWHTFSIISASIIFSLLLNYWGFIKLYL